MISNIETLLPTLSHGDHCCLLFSSPEDQLAVSVPFLAIGLERDERSMYVGDEESLERIRYGLDKAGIDVERELNKGRLVLSSERDYLEHGRFSSDKMLSFLQQTYDASLAEGFKALRATGDVSWEIGDDKDFRDVVYYETLLDVFFLGKRMVGMCQYPKMSCPPEVLSGILSTHRVAAIDSEICSNFHYVPPDLLLEKDHQIRHKKRVEWMTSQLRRARRAEEEIVRLNAELEQRVADRTAELQAAYRDMESFSYSISHDLRAPLRAIDGFATALAEDYSVHLDDQGRDYLQRLHRGAKRMGLLIEDLLKFSRLNQKNVSMGHVDMEALANTVIKELGVESVATVVELPPASGDRSLLFQVLANLIGNAVKFTRNQSLPEIQLGAVIERDKVVYFVQDNGAGFDMAHADKLFKAFQRLHSEQEFEGTGIGLALVSRIIQRHGGRVWAEGEVGKGATFYFTLPPSRRASQE